MRTTKAGTFLCCVSLIACGCSASARSEEIDTKQLLEKGVTITESKTAGTTVAVKDCSKLSEADFRTLGKLPHVKSISLGLGLTDAALASLADLAEIESLSSNGMQVSDDGIKALAGWKKLRSAAFFHPGALFTGAGLMHFQELPNLERLTVAGSDKFDSSATTPIFEREFKQPRQIAGPFFRPIG